VIPRRSLGAWRFNLIPGAWNYDAEFCYLVTTTERVIFLALSGLGRPTMIDWQAPIDQVEVVRRRSGPVWTSVHVKRKGDQKIIRFRCSRLNRVYAYDVTAAIEPGRL
jgi:hypothetical protein